MTSNRKARAPGNGKGAAPRPKRRLLYREIVDPVDPDFDPALALFVGSFPPDKRTPRQEIVAALEARRTGRLSPDNFRFLVCREGERVLGMCTGRYIDAVNIGFVGYLAVAPEQWGRTIGSTIRRHLVLGFRRDAALAGHDELEAVMGEVEATNPWLSILLGKRKVLAFDLDYHQPGIRPETEAVPLVLYYQPVANTEVPAALPAHKVAVLLKAIFKHIYRVEDPAKCGVLARMLSSLARRKDVGQHHLHVGGPGRRE
jgi:hypothetical protein